MADFNLFGQTITGVNGFKLADTNGIDHTYTEGGYDLPMFVLDPDTQVFTCDKSFAEMGNYGNALLGVYVEGALQIAGDVVLYQFDTDSMKRVYIVYRQYLPRPSAGIEYYSDGTITRIDPPNITTLTATANGTYTDSSNRLYSEVTVNVEGGGSSAWTKVAETSYQVSTTNTSSETVATWETGHSELWTSDKIVYVRIRDTAGKRAGHFYGTDTFFMNTYPANSSTATSTSSGSIINIWSVDTATGKPYMQRYGYSTTGYGVYPNMFYSDGKIRIMARVNSAYSRTIDGTYKVEVYLLDPPTGAPIFE